MVKQDELKRVAKENNLSLVDVWELNEQYKKENGLVPNNNILTIFSIGLNQ